MAYATVADVQARIPNTMTAAEQALCGTYLDDAAVIIDAYNADAAADAKKIVSCNMVIRKLGASSLSDVPIGATQGSLSALGYAQSWTLGSGGGSGELYLAKLDKKLLGVGNAIGSHSPVEDMACAESQ
jgi:hypothetical protein